MPFTLPKATYLFLDDTGSEVQAKLNVLATKHKLIIHNPCYYTHEVTKDTMISVMVEYYASEELIECTQ